VAGLRRAVVWDCCHRTLAIQFLSQERVRWIQPENGLHVDAYGQTYSTALWMLDESSRTGDLSFTIELWLRVAETRHPQASAIFSVHGGSDDSDLSIAQVGRDLVLQGHFRDRNGTDNVSYDFMMYFAARSLSS